jgi:predicted AAA+ superfamily ATPase
MINREFHLKQIDKRFKSAQIVAILGPRQCGKTTLAKTFKADLFFDLERPQDLAALENPEQALKDGKKLIVIDEIQRKPDLFPFLRFFVDKHKKIKILLLGSSSRQLIHQSSESLAGRISYYHLSGFSIGELKEDQQDRLWLRGGFPKSFLASSENTSLQWRDDYTRTFLEQDIPQLGIQIPALTLRKFWTLLGHYNGQILNYSEIGRNFGVSDATTKKYLELLAGTFMIEILAPWHANISKRQVKSPKFYFSDTGIFHSLAQIRNRKDLLSHPKLGASWESFVLRSIRARYDKEIYFWNTQSDAEIDFIIPQPKGLIGIEAKFSDAPRITPSMRIALSDLKLEMIYVIYPGERSYWLAPQIKVISLSELENTVRFS